MINRAKVTEGFFQTVTNIRQNFVAALFDAWVDGWGIAGNGSQVGYDTPPFAEQTIVNSGSQQSMPLSYDNTNGVTYSESVRTFDNPQDWTREDVQTLTLFFRGYPTAFVEEPGEAHGVSKFSKFFVSFAALSGLI